MALRQKVYISRRVPQAGIDLLLESFDVSIWDSDELVPRRELLHCVRGIQGLVCMPNDIIDEQVLNAAGPNLKVIGTMSETSDHIALSACRERGIRVATTTNVSVDSVADLTVALLLVVARRIPEGMASIEKGIWKSWRSMWLCGLDIRGRTLGIFGFGKVGSAVAHRLQPFGISRVIYTDVRHHDDKLSFKTDAVSFETLTAESDFLCICCALNEGTKEKFTRDVFRKMKRSAVLINTAAGAVINHDDLHEALKNREIFAAGLDATDPEPLPFNHPLVGMDNCTILPRLSYCTYDSMNSLSVSTAKSIISALNSP